VGIRGNKEADIAAMTGLDVAITNIRFSVSDLLTFVNQLCVRCEESAGEAHTTSATVPWN